MFSRTLCVFALTAVFAGSQGLPSWGPWGPSGKNNERNLNWVLDDILKSISSELVREGGDSIELPGSAVNTSTEIEILWHKFKATAVSSVGTLKNLSSVIRASDAGIAQAVDGGSLKDISLNAELSLAELEMVYPTASISVGFITYSGGLSVKCTENAFDIAIQVENKDSCPSTVKAASIKSLSGCSVKLLEGGFLNIFKQYILSFAFGKVVDSVKAVESAALLEVLTPIVQKHNICKFLNPANA